MAGRWGRMTLGVVALLALSGCSLLHPTGVSLDRETGRPVLEAPLCDDETVTYVRLYERVSTDGSWRTTRLLWQVRAITPSTRTRYVAGTTPPGFHEERHLLEPLPRHLELVAGTSGGGRSTSFVLDELSADHVLVDGIATSRDDLRTDARLACAWGPTALLRDFGFPATGYVLLAPLVLLIAWGMREGVRGRRASDPRSADR